MQLFFETQPTDDIKANMSTQAESSVNGVISDMKKELNFINKENNHNIDEGTIAILEKSLSNKTGSNIDRLTSESDKDIVLREEQSNGIEKNNCDLEVIETTQKVDLLDNLYSQVSENSTNGSKSQDKVELDCGNPHTRTENLLTTKEHIDVESHLTSNSDESYNSSKKDEIAMFEVPKESNEISSSNTDIKLQEPESSSEGKVPIEVLDTTNMNESSYGKVIEMSDVTKEGLENVAKVANSKIIGEETKHVSSSENMNAPANNSKSYKINTDKNVSIDGEINKTLEVLEDVVFNNEAEMQNDKIVSKCESSVKHPDNLSIVEKLDELSEVRVDIDTLVDDKILDDSNLVSMDKENLNVAMHEVEKTCTSHIENLVLTDTEKFEPMAVNKDVELAKKPPELNLLPVIEDTDDASMSKSTIMQIDGSTIIDKKESVHDEVLENALNKYHENLESVVNTTKPSDENVQIHKEKEVEISLMEIDDVEIVDLDIDKPDEDINMIENASNDVGSKKTEIVKITEFEPLSEQNTNESMTKLPIDKKTDLNGIENASMEIDDVEIVNFDKDKPDVDIKKIENASNDVGNNKTQIVKITEFEPLSVQNTNESMTKLPINKKTNLNRIEPASMEIVDVEMVDFDKETQDKNICNTETTLNDGSNKETNLVQKSESEQLPEKNVNESSTELRNENVKSRDTAVPVLINTVEETENIETKKFTEEDQDKVEVVDEDDIKIVENIPDNISNKNQEKEKSPELQEKKTLPVVCKLSNTLDILSDDEEDSSKMEKNKMENSRAEKQSINIDDDDDIMLIEEDSNSKEATDKDKMEVSNEKKETQSKPNNKTDIETGEKHATSTDITALAPTINEKDVSSAKTPTMDLESAPQTENKSEEQNEKAETKKPLLPQNFLKTAKKNLADMTRHELEDFCILRIVESIVDRSNFSDIKTKMKTMAQNLEDYKKRAMMLTKQNRDLQVVLKSVQEEQKKRTNAPIQPLKITRSVGMQVLMNDKVDSRKKGQIPNQVSTIAAGRPARAVQVAKVPNKPLVSLPAIPVPRKVPVNNSPAKTLTTTPTNNIGNKAASPNPNGLRNPSPVQKAPEKRTHSRMQATSSVTVDLTDDEPPPKINNKNAPVPPVRVVPPQNLLAQQRPFAQPLNSPRKVYIPISGPQAQNIRPGQTLVMKSIPPPGPRQRMPAMPRMQQSPIRINKQVAQRHPAPLPDAMKQYTPPTWKALPPAPDLKLSKVENGIVISWKIDGLENGYETVASYQLYAYQETTSPPSTALWKKIGDVKALPLPMACTLTQFMAGFKYYFAVRAVDVRSRIGPFSLPGSILLLNKM